MVTSVQALRADRYIVSLSNNERQAEVARFWTEKPCNWEISRRGFASQNFLIRSGNTQQTMAINQAATPLSPTVDPDREAARARQRFHRFSSIFALRGKPIRKGMTLLDFGCGSGHLVKECLLQGLDAYGCDIDFLAATYDQALLGELKLQDRAREIHTDRMGAPGADRLPIGAKPEGFRAYRLPFADATFDFVVSSEVLEHVANYKDVAHELHRVMKPGAVFLHVFPPKFAILEGHTNIPFGGGFNPTWWLKVWAHLGLRVWHHKGLTAGQYVTWARHYLDTCVNYLTKSQLQDVFRDGFDLRFVERDLFRIRPLCWVFIFPSLYSSLRCRVMYGTKR